MRSTWSIPCGRAGRSWVAGVAALLLCGWVGCGGEPFKFVPVSGKVTYTDGSLIPGDQILVRFVPEQPPTSGTSVAPAATGEVNPKDGTFDGLTTHKALDGAVPGTHKVIVVAMKAGPDGVPVPTRAVPEKYQSPTTTPLKWEVGDGKPVELKIEKGR